METELYHYGVKGMKWGVRRAQRKAARQVYRSAKNQAFDRYERDIAAIEKPYKRGQNLSDRDLKREAAAEKRYSDAVAKAKADYKAAKATTQRTVHDDYERAHSKKHVSEMSDKELRERNNRLQMEQQYANLTKRKNHGEKIVKSIIATAGTIVALEGAYKTYKRLGDGALNKIGDWVLKDLNLSGPFA